MQPWGQETKVGALKLIHLIPEGLLTHKAVKLEGREGCTNVSNEFEWSQPYEESCTTARARVAVVHTQDGV